MDDKQDTEIRHTIAELVAEEHRLRGEGRGLDDDAKARLTQLEIELDRAWDLLRQREAARDRGANPDLAEARPANEVEGYLQ